MRVVDYQRNTQSVAYRALWALGVISALFATVVCALMIVNNLRLKSTDPIHSPALQKLVQELKGSPQDEALKEQIREMDFLARQAFFTSHHFNRIAIWLLLGGAAVALASFKTLSAYHRAVPFPDAQDAKTDLAANAAWARRSVTVVALILIGLALSLALPWQSPLDRAPRDAVADSASSPPRATPAMVAPAPVSHLPPLTSRLERAKQWPSFRGPASGHATATRLPVQWDGKTGTGILWKTALPLPGFGSPIVWGDRVFLAGAHEKSRAVYAMDARSGKLLWEQAVATRLDAHEVPEVSPDTGHAAPTMATDGERVFAIFATGDLVAFDLDGKPAWAQHLGVPVNAYGHSSSLEIFADLLIVQFDHKKDGFVAGLDVRTGATRWKTERKLGSSWASPLLLETDGHPELILVANAFVTAYDPHTGRELWQLKCLASADVAPTPVFANGQLFVAADHVKFAAIDIKTHRVTWETKEPTPGVGTPVAVGDWLFAGLSEGGIACWDARSGTRLWLQETDDGFYSSPIVAGARVFLFDRTGKMFIFDANGAAYQPVAQPTLGEDVVATPAIYGESLICRGAKNLFRIGS